MNFTRRAGFSLIEALVVLAIGGMALAVIFSIGIKAGDTGFALGRRAMSAADKDVSLQDVRTILRNIEVRPTPHVVKGLDRPFIGTPERLEANVIMTQATACAPQGWAGRLSLSLVRDGVQTRLICQADQAIELMSWTGIEEAGFAYSRDGLAWTSALSTPEESAGFQDEVYSEKLWIALNKIDGGDIVEKLSSGDPIRWFRSDASQ